MLSNNVINHFESFLLYLSLSPPPPSLSKLIFTDGETVRILQRNDCETKRRKNHALQNNETVGKVYLDVQPDRQTERWTDRQTQTERQTVHAAWTQFTMWIVFKQSSQSLYPIQYNMSVHHYECVALCFVNILQRARSWAAKQCWRRWPNSCLMNVA